MLIEDLTSPKTQASTHDFNKFFDNLLNSFEIKTLIGNAETRKRVFQLNPRKSIVYAPT
jgi:hypothetical protein